MRLLACIYGLVLSEEKNGYEGEWFINELDTIRIGLFL